MGGNTKSNNRKDTNPSDSSTGRFNELVAKYFKLLTIAIFILAAFIRFGYVTEVANGPLNSISIRSNTDANFFNDWSHRINEGNVWSTNNLHPVHSWHKDVAGEYFKNKNISVSEGELELRSKELWNRWYGNDRWHQGPLYPYVNALLYRVFNNKFTIIFFLQVFLSLLSLYFLMQLGKMYFGELAALVGGLLFAFYGPSVFFDGILLRASAITMFTLAIVFSGEQLIRNQRIKNGVLLGIFSGLGLLLKPTLVVLYLVILFYAGWKLWRHKKVAPLLISLAVFFVTIGPGVLRNMKVGSPLFSFSSVAAVTFLNSNNQNYEPSDGFVVDASLTARVLEQTDGDLVPVVKSTFSSFSSLGELVSLEFRKAKLLLSNYEVPNNFNFYFHKSYSRFLRIAFVNSAFIMGFGFFGLTLILLKRRFNLLVIALLIQLAILLAFYIICRFKTPFIVCLIPFAGYGISHVISEIQLNLKKGLTVSVVPLALVGLFLFMPPNPAVKLRYADLNSFWMEHYLKEIRKLPPNDRKGMALIFEEMISHQPAALNQRNSKLKQIDKPLIVFYANAYADLADLYKGQGLTNLQAQALKESKKLQALSEQRLH